MIHWFQVDVDCLETSADIAALQKIDSPLIIIHQL